MDFTTTSFPLLRFRTTDPERSPQTFGLMHCGNPSASPERNDAREALGLFFSAALVKGQDTSLSTGLELLSDHF